MAHAADVDILRHAAEENRIVITADLDYPRLLAVLHSSEPSLILFRGGAWTEEDLKERLCHLFGLIDEPEFKGAIYVIGKNSIRRRTLPIE